MASEEDKSVTQPEEDEVSALVSEYKNITFRQYLTSSMHAVFLPSYNDREITLLYVRCRMWGKGLLCIFFCAERVRERCNACAHDAKAQAIDYACVMCTKR